MLKFYIKERSGTNVDSARIRRIKALFSCVTRTALGKIYLVENQLHLFRKKRKDECYCGLQLPCEGQFAENRTLNWIGGVKMIPENKYACSMQIMRIKEE